MSDSLREIPLFSELSARDRRRLAGSMQERSFSAGEKVVAEGERGVGFFVILDGRAVVTQGGETRTVLSAGDYFGEMSLIDGDDRTATVTAEDDLRCAVMSMDHFRPFVKDHPDVGWALLRAVVRRLRESQARAVAAG